MAALKPADIDSVLDLLQTVYRFRLEVDLIPSVLREPFYGAAKRFREPEELKKIDKSKMGICEETADLTYQVLKMLCLIHNILTEKEIRVLQDYLVAHHYYDSDGKLAGLDYRGLDALSVALVPDRLVRKLLVLLPESLFLSGKDKGFAIMKEFLAGQFVAYISRVWRGHKAGGLQTVEYLRDEKIPEETRELVEALVRSGENVAGEAGLADLAINLNLSSLLLNDVGRFRESADAINLLNRLAEILELKIKKSVTVEDTLRLMFLKMKGRQEMDFCGIDEITMRRTCKPVEYLIEADMFF